MIMIFDGKAFAKEIETEVENKVRNLPAQAGLVKKPRIASVVVGDDPASTLYTRLKQKAAERVGIQFDVIKLEISNNQAPIIKQKVAEIAAREDVTGVMVQLPLPGVSRKDTEEILKAIPLDKDVDGLRWEESGVMPATVMAVLAICQSIANNQYPIINNQTKPNHQMINKFWEMKFVVLGARGVVGRPLVYSLRKMGLEVTEIEWDTPDPAGSLIESDVIISCVGKAGLVTGTIVKGDVIAIDVGMSAVNNQTNPNGKNSKEFDDWNLSIGDSRQSRVVGDMTNEVYQKALVAVPVPGGVGPVTVASLMVNAWEIFEKNRRN